MTGESKRGLIMAVWALAVWHLPSMHALQFYGGLADLVAWAGRPQTIYGAAGVLTGCLVIAAAELDWQIMRRALAIASMGYWLLVASGFAGASPTLPATVLYAGMALLHVRTALGMAPR